MKFTDITDFLGITDSRMSAPIEPESKKFNRDSMGPKKVVLEWSAIPKIPTRTMPVKFKKTLLIIGAVVFLLLLMMKEFVIIFTILSIAFLNYALSKNPISSQKYQITTHGIDIASRFYYWDEMEKFFFNDEQGIHTLTVDLKEGFAKRLFIPYFLKDKEKIKTELNKYLQYLEEPPIMFLDKTYGKVLDKFNFEEDKKK